MYSAPLSYCWSCIQSVLHLNIYAIDAKILPESAHYGILDAAKLDHTR